MSLGLVDLAVADTPHLALDTLQVDPVRASAGYFWDSPVGGKGYTELSLDCASDVEWRGISNGDVGEFLRWTSFALLLGACRWHVRRLETNRTYQVPEMSGQRCDAAKQGACLDRYRTDLHRWQFQMAYVVLCMMDATKIGGICTCAKAGWRPEISLRSTQHAGVDTCIPDGTKW